MVLHLSVSFTYMPKLTAVALERESLILCTIELTIVMKFFYEPFLFILSLDHNVLSFMLSDFNQNWNIWTNFINSPQYKI